MRAGVDCPRWHQAGNRTSHCAGCHLTFSGIAAFDRHQTIRHNKSDCRHPALATRKDGVSPLHVSYLDREAMEAWKIGDTPVTEMSTGLIPA